MAKKLKSDAADVAAAAPEVAAAVEVVAPVAVDIVLRRDLPFGTGELARGTKLATVTLEPGIHLNYLSRCIEDAFAGPAE